MNQHIKPVVINYMNQEVHCYGEISPEENISICCDDEIGDGIYADGFENWTEAVHHLIDNYRRDIVQLEVC